MVQESPHIIDTTTGDSQKSTNNTPNVKKDISKDLETTQERILLPFVVNKPIDKQKPEDVLFFGSSSISSLALCAIRMGDDIPKCYGANAGELDYSRSGRRMLDSRTLYNNEKDESKGTFNDPSIINKFTEVISNTDGNKVIVLNGGFNDIFYKKNNRELLTIETELKDAFTKIIDKAHDKGMQVVLLTISVPFSGSMANNHDEIAIAHNINRWLLKNSHADAIIDVNNEIFVNLRKDDGHHLNNNGLKAVYRTVKLLTMRQKD